MMTSHTLSTSPEKTNNIFFYFLLFILAMVFGSCGKEMPQTTAVPALLDRPAALQYANEWDAVQNTYASNRRVLAQKSNAHESALKLIELFLNEARITGEHGHYYPAALQLCAPILNDKSASADDNFRAKSLKASALLSQHEFALALELIESVAAQYPYNAAILGALVDAQVELGNYDAAVDAADRMIALRPDLRSYSRVSYLRELYGDIPGALAALKLAMQAGYPGYEETAWTGLTYANLLMETGDLQKAEAVLEQILTQRKDYPFAIAALGEIEMKKSNPRTAEKLFNEAANIIPEVGFYISLAALYKQENRTEELQSILTEIETMFQEDIDSGHNMSMELADFHLHLSQDYEQALSYVKAEYQLRPKNTQVNKLLAEIYEAMNQTALSELHDAKSKLTIPTNPKLGRLTSH